MIAEQIRDHRPQTRLTTGRQRPTAPTPTAVNSNSSREWSAREPSGGIKPFSSVRFVWFDNNLLLKNRIEFPPNIAFK